MNTLIIFLIVFLPISWFIWSMLRFTRDTIGTNSPLKVRRVYKTDFWTFFGRLENIITAEFLFIGLLFLYISLFGYLSYKQSRPELTRFLLFLFSMIPLGAGLLVLSLELNHWSYVKGIVIETLPEEHELEIKIEDVAIRLKQGSIQKIRIIHNDGSRWVHGYVEYYLDTGDYFILSFKTHGQWVIQEYFKNLPTEYVVRKIPFISVLK